MVFLTSIAASHAADFLSAGQTLSIGEALESSDGAGRLSLAASGANVGKLVFVETATGATKWISTNPVSAALLKLSVG